MVQLRNTGAASTEPRASEIGAPTCSLQDWRRSAHHPVKPFAVVRDHRPLSTRASGSSRPSPAVRARDGDSARPHIITARSLCLSLRAPDLRVADLPPHLVNTAFPHPCSQARTAMDLAPPGAFDRSLTPRSSSRSRSGFKCSGGILRTYAKNHRYSGHAVPYLIVYLVRLRTSGGNDPRKRGQPAAKSARVEDNLGGSL
jgi:hypothetical protein